MERPAYVTRCPVCLASVEIEDVYRYEWKDDRKVRVPFDVDRLVRKACPH